MRTKRSRVESIMTSAVETPDFGLESAGDKGSKKARRRRLTVSSCLIARFVMKLKRPSWILAFSGIEGAMMERLKKTGTKYESDSYGY